MIRWALALFAQHPAHAAEDTSPHGFNPCCNGFSVATVLAPTKLPIAVRVSILVVRSYAVGFL